MLCIISGVLQSFRCFHTKHPLFSHLIWPQIKRIIVLALFSHLRKSQIVYLNYSVSPQSGLASDHQWGGHEKIQLEIRLLMGKKNGLWTVLTAFLHRLRSHLWHLLSKSRVCYRSLNQRFWNLNEYVGITQFSWAGLGPEFSVSNKISGGANAAASLTILCIAGP